MTLIRLAGAWLLGILVACCFPVPLDLLLLTGTALGASYLLWRSNDITGSALLTALCLVGGMARYSAASFDYGRDHIARLNGRAVVVRGRVVAEPDRRDRRTGYRVEVERCRSGEEWTPARGAILVWLPRHPAFAYGELVEVSGRLEQPPVLDDFDYRSYLARRGIHSVAERPTMTSIEPSGGNPLRCALLAAKNRAREVLASSLPEPEASLATGILLGDARRMPRHVDEAFQLTNTTHVIAISGANVSLLVVGLMATIGRVLGRRWRLPVVLTLLALYTALVGADAAVVRAAIMGGLIVFGRHLGRPGHAPTLLFAAAWAMTAYRPSYLWDLGFQLSFAATLGLLWLTEPCADLYGRILTTGMTSSRARRLVAATYEAVVVTTAAQLATWPIIAHSVGQVSLAGLLANFLILPAQPPLMVLGAVSTLAGLVVPSLGRALAVLAWLPLAYTIRTVELAAKLPYACVAVRVPPSMLLVYYVGLLLAASASGVPRSEPARSGWPHAAALRRTREWCAELVERVGQRRARLAEPGEPAPFASSRGWLALSGLASLCAVAWLAAFSRPDGRLHVHLLDVGQGDSILIESPNGRRMVVDGGPSPSAVLDGLGRRLPPWDRRIDVVVLTHPDADHIGGLSAVLERYNVSWIVDPQLEAATADAALWERAVEREHAVLVRASSGGRVVLDEAAELTAHMLWPPGERAKGEQEDLNESSVILRLTYGSIAVLLTGDAGSHVEHELLRSGELLAADVLKVSHHGSAGGTTEEFLAAVGPSVAMIGVGKDNSFGHPAAQVLDRLEGIPVWRTDLDGAVELISDGHSIWVR